MKEILNETLTGERALFQDNELRIGGTVFDDGEAPLKHTRYIELSDCTFKSKYYLWYSNFIKLKDCRIDESGSEGMWYTSDVKISDTVIDAHKTFRRSKGISLRNVQFTNSNETLWKCNNIRMYNVKVKGDYLGMDCDGMEISGLELEGDHCFDGARNITVRNSVLNSRDAFWNTENVIIYDSTIKGDFFGWNSRNIVLVNCIVESHQGMCYIENLSMRNCKLPNTDLAFEYSTVNADIRGHIDSIKNPTCGIIQASSVGEMILEKDKVDITRTKVICAEKE